MAIAFYAVAEGSAINGGNVTLTLPTSQVAGDYNVVTYAIPTSTGTLTVTTSSGGPFTQIVPTTNSTTAVVLRLGTFAYTQTNTIITQAICAGTAGTSDGISAVCMVFRDDALNITLDATSQVATGSGTTPDSPSITVVSSNDVILSCVGSNVTDTAVTAPTSFVNQVDVTANDTRDTTVGMAMITLASTAAFNPASWTGFTSGGWVAATVALKPGSTAYPEIAHVVLEYPVTYYRPIEMVPY